MSHIHSSNPIPTNPFFLSFHNVRHTPSHGQWQYGFLFSFLSLLGLTFRKVMLLFATTLSPNMKLLLVRYPIPVKIWQTPTYTGISCVYKPGFTISRKPFPYFPSHSYSPPFCIKNHILLPYNPTTLSQNCGVRHRHGFAAKPFMVLYGTSTTPAMGSCLFASQLIWPRARRWKRFLQSADWLGGISWPDMVQSADLIPIWRSSAIVSAGALGVHFVRQWI